MKNFARKLLLGVALIFGVGIIEIWLMEAWTCSLRVVPVPSVLFSSCVSRALKRMLFM